MARVTVRTPVHMYHDIENVKITIRDEVFVETVEKALRTFNPHYFLAELILCGRNDKNTEERAARMKTDVCTVKYVEATARELICAKCGVDYSQGVVISDPLIRKKEVADRVLIERFLSYTARNTDAVILVVSSDKDFSYAMQYLHRESYTVLSSCEDPNTRMASLNICYAAWIWGVMENGEECYRSSIHCYLLAKMDGPPELLFSHGGHKAKISDFAWKKNDIYDFFSEFRFGVKLVVSKHTLVRHNPHSIL